jgi:hypothetical protein
MTQEENKTESEEPTIHQLTDDEYTAFYTLVQLLVDNHFDVHLSHKQEAHDDYYYECRSRSTGYRKAVRFAFCTPTHHVHSSLSGGFCADHIDCFDKWTKCPLMVPFPKGEEEEALLISYLDWLGSEDGFEKSNIFDVSYYAQNYEDMKKVLTKLKSE